MSDCEPFTQRFASRQSHSAGRNKFSGFRRRQPSKSNRFTSTGETLTDFRTTSVSPSTQRSKPKSNERKRQLSTGGRSRIKRRANAPDHSYGRICRNRLALTRLTDLRRGLLLGFRSTPRAFSEARSVKAQRHDRSASRYDWLFDVSVDLYLPVAETLGLARPAGQLASLARFSRLARPHGTCRRHVSFLFQVQWHRRRGVLDHDYRFP